VQRSSQPSTHPGCTCQPSASRLAGWRRRKPATVQGRLCATAVGHAGHEVCTNAGDLAIRVVVPKRRLELLVAGRHLASSRTSCTPASIGFQYRAGKRSPGCHHFRRHRCCRRSRSDKVWERGRRRSQAPPCLWFPRTCHTCCLARSWLPSGNRCCRSLRSRSSAHPPGTSASRPMYHRLWKSWEEHTRCPQSRPAPSRPFHRSHRCRRWPRASIATRTTRSIIRAAASDGKEQCCAKGNDSTLFHINLLNQRPQRAKLGAQTQAGNKVLYTTPKGKLSEVRRGHGTPPQCTTFPLCFPCAVSLEESAVDRMTMKQLSCSSLPSPRRGQATAPARDGGREANGALHLRQNVLDSAPTCVSNPCCLRVLPH